MATTLPIPRTQSHLRTALSPRDASPPEVQLPDGEEVWVAERLDGFRFHYHRPQYFVIYEGYGVDDGMWQDRDNLMETCPQMVRDADVKYNYLQLVSQTRSVPDKRIPPPTPERTSTPARRPVGRPRKVPLPANVAPEPAPLALPPNPGRVRFARRSGRSSTRSSTCTPSIPSR